MTDSRENPWEAIVAASTRRDDEREREIRYRAGHRALTLLTAMLVIAGVLVAAIAGDSLLSGSELGMILGLAGALGYLLHAALSWPAYRAAAEETRKRLTRNRAARRLAWIWMLATDLFAIGMFFIIGYYGGEMPFWSALASATGLVVVMTLVLSRALTAGPSRRGRGEEEEATD